MSQTAVLADGTRLEFPDDTPAEVIQSTVKRLVAQTDSGLPLPPSSPPSWTERVMSGYKAVSDPVTDVVALAARNNPIARLGLEAQRGLSWLTNGAIAPPPDEEAITKASRQAGELLVPQTPAQAGMMLLGPAGRAAGVAVAGPATSFTRQFVIPALGAVAGSAAGGAGGAAISGQDPIAAAEQGAAGALLGEGVGWGLGALARKGPGGKTRMANQDAARMLDTIDELSPGFTKGAVPEKVAGAVRAAPLSPSERLHGAISSPTTREGKIPALEGMGAEKEATVQAIEDALMGRRLFVPSVDPSRPVTLREANRALTEIGEGLRHQDILDPALRTKKIREAYGVVSNEIRDALDAAQRANEQGIAAVHQRMTRPPRALPPRTEPGVPGPPRTFEAGPLPEVVDVTFPPRPNLQPMRTAGVRTDPGASSFDPPFGVPPAQPPVITARPVTTAHDVTPRPTPDMRPGPAPWWPRGQEGASVPTGPLPEAPPLSAMWEVAQGPYRRGMGVLDFLSSPNAWRTGPKGVEINMNAIQRALKNPEILAELHRALGPEGVDKFARAATRGAGLGRVDRLAAGEGQIGSSLGEWLRGSNTGSTTLLTTPLRAILPGFGDRYVGRVPYALPPVPQILSDALAQRLIQQATE